MNFSLKFELIFFSDGRFLNSLIVDHLNPIPSLNIFQNFFGDANLKVFKVYSVI
jgi:hypothetical protein